MTVARVSDGVYVALNAASFHLQGFRPEELLGRSALESVSWKDAAERAAFIEQVRQSAGRFETEKRLKHKNGSWLDCRIWATLVDVDGESCLMCAALDITAQRQRESLLLDLAQNLAAPAGEPFFRTAARYMAKATQADLVMVAELDQDGQLATLALWKDEARVANTRFAPDQAPFAAALASTEAVWQTHQSGLRYADVFAGPDDLFQASAAQVLRDAHGTPIGLLCAWWKHGQDNTGERTALFSIMANRINPELVRLRRDREIFRLKASLEQRVLARTVQLRATNAELESFAYSVSHDLQSPLRSIQGYLFLLERKLKPGLVGEEKRLLERVNANVLRMHELINDLLALARVSRGTLAREAVDLSQIAQQVMADLQSSAPQRAVRLSIAEGLHAQCDPKLARIVLENLLGNAWKYTRHAAVVEIELGVETPAERGEAEPVLPGAAADPAVPAQQVFFIRDNGAGFSMDYAHGLFKPFHRLHHENEFEGSGIGLATVHRILERHGGHIRGEAVEGYGACFYFAFEGELSATEN